METIRLKETSFVYECKKFIDNLCFFLKKLKPGYAKQIILESEKEREKQEEKKVDEKRKKINENFKETLESKPELKKLIWNSREQIQAFCKINRSWLDQDTYRPLFLFPGFSGDAYTIVQPCFRDEYGPASLKCFYMGLCNMYEFREGGHLKNKKYEFIFMPDDFKYESTIFTM